MGPAGTSAVPLATEAPSQLLESRAALRILAAAALIATAIHFIALESAPPGLYVDEASYGYNAYSILHTGRDEAGESFPLFFRAFGEYKGPVLVYGLVPLLAVLGPTPLAVRLGSAIFALACALFVAMVVREATGRRGLARLAFVLAALVPWAFTPSRVATESIVLPFAIAFAWWAWLAALRTRRVPLFVAAWVGWALAWFSYPAGRLLAPVLAVVLVGISWRELRGSRVRCFLAALPLMIPVAVLMRWVGEHPGALTARLKAVAGWQGSAGLAANVVGIAARYIGYFSPRFLFTHGDPSLRHHSGFGGELFLFMLPLLVAGIALAIRQRSVFSTFALAGFLTFPLAACLAESPVHAQRTIGAVPFVIVLVIIGTAAAVELLSHHPRILAVSLGVVVLEVAAFLVDFFAFYPARASAWFNRGLPEAVQTAISAQRTDLFFSSDAFRDENVFVNQPYIFFAFLGELDPGTLRRGGLAAYRIFPLETSTKPAPGAVLLLKDNQLFTAGGGAVLFPSRVQIPPGARVVAEFPAYSGHAPPGPMYRVIAVP
jgi:4-amino-4-deoxy-L-arabinose transferase-like glycosyltransferase